MQKTKNCTDGCNQKFQKPWLGGRKVAWTASERRCDGLGVFILGDGEKTVDSVLSLFEDNDLESLIDIEIFADGCRLSLRKEALCLWGEDYDTGRIPDLFGCGSFLNEEHLEREIVLALFGSPEPFSYQTLEEFIFAIHVRRNIVREASKTQLAFSAEEADRPEEYWDYSEEKGFLIKPGKPIVQALRAATQPEVSGRQYAFSCYRATEYVHLLALALELGETDRPTLARLQRQYETRAIKSRQFHDLFLHEYGSMEKPLPQRFYVPGDRLWFRNPDPVSSDISGYEGSWVYYLGHGLFSNFWRCSEPYTLERKSIEIYHWRHGMTVDSSGTAWMDESEVERQVSVSMRDPELKASILQRMLRYRDRSGEYGDGGCVDTTREYPKFIGCGVLGFDDQC